MQSLRSVVGLAVLLLSGCADVLSPDTPTVSITFHLQQQSTNPPILQVDLGGRRKTVNATASEFPDTRLTGLRFGPMPAHVVLLRSPSDTLAVVAFTHELHRDHEHWVSGTVGQRRPQGHCIGALVVAPLRGSATDSLFVTYGRLLKGTVC